MNNSNLEKIKAEAEQALNALDDVFEGILIKERLICKYADYMNPEQEAQLQDSIHKINEFVNKHQKERDAGLTQKAGKKALHQP